MNKKGIGSIVSYILIILLTVVGVAIFIGAFLRGVDKNTSDESASCLGIDLKLNGCVIIPMYIVSNFLPDTGEAVIVNVERSPGGGEIKDLRFAVLDTLGNTHVEEPVNLEIGNVFKVDTNYSDFLEYESDDALLRNLSYNPVSISVSAVVGDSQTICPATRPSINCVIYGTNAGYIYGG